MTLASFALALMLLAEPSDQSLKTMTLEQLANIEVTTVTKEAKAASKTSAAIFVITGDDIRRSGATSIPEVLRLAPGVEVSQIDSGHWSVGIRGFQGQFSSAVLVLIDGRSVYTPLFAGVYWDVQNTLLEDVERIEIIRGPGGTIWGANAFQGVINIITRSSKDTHGTLATVGGGSIDQATAAVRFGGGNGSTFDYRAYGQMFSRGPEKHPDDRQFDDWRMQQFGFRTDWNRSSRDSLTVQGDTYHGDVGEMVSTASFSPAAEVDLQGNDLVSGGNIRAQWQHDMSRAGKLQVQTFYDRTNRTAPHYKETRDTVDLDVLHHFALPARQNISWGFGVRWSPGDFTPLIPTIDFQPGKKTERIYSAFVQDEIPLLHDKLSLLLGNKWERNIYTGVEVQPSARLEWSLSEHHTFWAAVTQAVRTPSRLDRDFQLKAYLTTVGVPFYLEIDGSPAFNSERLAGTAAGYRSLITSKFHIDISAYHNRYHYLSSRGDSAPLSIQTTPITYVLLFKIPYANGVGGTTDGFEIAPEWNATAWWQWRGSYSSLHMNLKNEPGNSDTSQMALYEGSSPHHQASLQSHMDLAKKFELDVAWRYVSALPAQAVAAYQTADVRWGWSLSKAVELSLNGTNLLQPHHAEFGRSPQATVESVRSVYAKLDVEKIVIALLSLALFQQPGEYQVKAAFLYNFGKFVNWPPNAPSAKGDSFRVCVLGSDPFGTNLDSILKDEHIDGKKIIARRIDKAQEAADCRILFISTSESSHLKEIFTAVGNTGVLTVSDMPQFVQSGGMIQFVLDGTRVRFEINRRSAIDAGLTLSSELLKVAAAVR